MAGWKIALITAAVLTLGGIAVGFYFYKYAELDIYVPMFADNCGQCHGANLEGTERGVALIAGELRSGDSVGALQNSIKNGHVGLGHLEFMDALSATEIKGLAIYIGERRMGQRFTDFRFDRDVQVPAEVLTSEQHNFTLETVVDGLAPMVFSIEPLPDGSLIVTEKERGLSIVSAAGVQSDLIQGTPAMGSSIDVRGIQYGSGWLLDVATHPDYVNNGWIYLHYTHLCADECASGMMSKSMNRLDRGRIRDGQWTDVQTIWQSPHEFYAATPDTGAGGRIAFDGSGHVFLSVGIKSADGTNDTTAQDLSSPYGKIHRVNDDGSVPESNPFLEAPVQPGANPSVRDTIWTYGHRSPQGLEWHPGRERVWNSEMGPRGGDELNELLPGRNYGWPYHSLGLEYLGTRVQRHKTKAVEFDDHDVEQTLVDITPSPAISSFAVYTADQFPRWRNSVLIGSLKGSSLFRMAFEGTELIARETLIKDLARIRDVEVGYDGLVYLLLESKSGSSIVRLRPA
ncbi:MAG: PQQ-dependent sugar dehydrogenase [Pseudomonadales bacterium]